LSSSARFILGLLCLFALPGTFRVFGDGLKIVSSSSDVWEPFLYGFVPGAILYYIIRRFRIVKVFETFEHELTHAIVALLFLRRIRNFTVTPDEGGSVQHTGGFGGGFGDEMIGLAPYYLPTFAFFSAFLYPFLHHRYYRYLHAWIGITLAYHTISTLIELKSNWTKTSFHEALTHEPILTDIGKRGYLYSAISIVTFTLVFHSLIVWLMSRGVSSLSRWWVLFFDTNVIAFLGFSHWLKNLIDRFR